MVTGTGNRAFFAASDPAHGDELWSTDGTAAGTRLVQSIAKGASWSLPSNLTPSADALWFTANDGVHGREIWELPK